MANEYRVSFGGNKRPKLDCGGGLTTLNIIKAPNYDFKWINYRICELYLKLLKKDVRIIQFQRRN